MILFTVLEISEMLEVSRRTINSYITRGILKASVDEDGFYKVSRKELSRFEDEFFYTKKRTLKKGNGNRIDKESIEKLELLITQVNEGLGLEEIVKEHENIEIVIPKFNVYLSHLRHESVKEDREKGLTYSELEDKYNLSYSGIRNILKK